MTTNQERAHALISSAIDTLALDPTTPWFERELPKITQALADAGPLMPDLPGPDTVNAAGLETWGGPEFMVVRSGKDIQVNVNGVAAISGELHDLTGQTSIHRIRKAALAMLAAANHAEQEKS